MANRRSATDLVRAVRAKAHTLPRVSAEAAIESASRVEEGKGSATVADLADLGAFLHMSPADVYRKIA